MAKKGRVLYYGKEGELFIEMDGVEERLVFISPNKSGFSGITLLELENNCKSMMSAAKEFEAVIEELKERVYDRAKGMLGYKDYVSQKELDEKERRENEDEVLSKMKVYNEVEAI